MQPTPVTIALPIADRPTSFAFYRDGLGLEPIGDPADDGVPEPLQLRLNDGARLMLVPTGGFGWVIGDHEVADRGHVECVLSIPVASRGEVDALVAQAEAAGATVVTPHGEQPWGYESTFADPDGHLWQVTVEAPPG